MRLEVYATPPVPPLGRRFSWATELTYRYASNPSATTQEETSRQQQEDGPDRLNLLPRTREHLLLRTLDAGKGHLTFSAL